VHAPETERTRDLIESQLVAKMLSKLGLFAKAKPSAYSMRDDNDGSSPMLVPDETYPFLEPTSSNRLADAT